MLQPTDQDASGALDEYRSLLESYPAPIFIYDVETLCILAVNEAATGEYQYRRDELVGKELFDLHPPEDRAAAREVLEPVRAGMVRGRRKLTRGLRHVRKDGSILEFEVTGQPIVFQGRAARITLVRDVSEARKLQALGERHQALLDRSRDMVFFLSPDGRILDANGAALRAYGYTHAEIVRLRISDLREPSTVSEVPRQLAQAESEGIFIETVHRRKDGTCFPVEVSSRGVTIAGERVLVSISRDVSARRRDEEMVRRRERWLRLLAERSSEGLTVCRGTRVVWASPALGAWLGRSPEALAGTDAGALLHSDDRPAFEALVMAGEGTFSARLAREDGATAPATLEAQAAVDDEAPEILLLTQSTVDGTTTDGGSPIVEPSPRLAPEPAAPAQLEAVRGPLEALRESIAAANQLWRRGPSGRDPREVASQISRALDRAEEDIERLRAALAGAGARPLSMRR